MPQNECRRMPTDEVTGLPHAIHPGDLSYVNQTYPEVTYHHHFYNRRDPDLEGPEPLAPGLLTHPEDIPLPRIAGLAVRMSRGQRLPAAVHKRVHGIYGLGPALPHTLNDKFTTAVKACSGVVSRRAIDITADDPTRLIDMDNKTFTRVASPKLLCTERSYTDRAADTRRKVLGNFFLRYAIKQDFSHVSDKFDIFLHTTDDGIRRVIGREILREAMEVGIAPVIPIYKELKLQGYVQPGRPDLRTAVWKFIHPERQEKVFRVLRKKLLAA